jgi:hypothetical protein
VVGSLYRGKEEEYRNPELNMRVKKDKMTINGEEVVEEGSGEAVVAPKTNSVKHKVRSQASKHPKHISTEAADETVDEYEEPDS